MYPDFRDFRFPDFRFLISGFLFLISEGAPFITNLAFRYGDKRGFRFYAGVRPLSFAQAKGPTLRCAVPSGLSL